MVKLYVEGGGNIDARSSSKLRTKCRDAFRFFFESAGIKNKPRVVACGSRNAAFRAFCTAINKGDSALLLVDSEAPVAPECQTGAPQEWRPWQHLKNRQGDGWDKPDGAEDRQCHLMVQCMESWLVADRETLSQYFGQGFSPRKLPPLPNAKNAIESVDKTTLLNALQAASKDCPKGPYAKGAHSFSILKQIRADKICAASPWAKRLIDELQNALDKTHAQVGA